MKLRGPSLALLLFIQGCDNWHVVRVTINDIASQRNPIYMTIKYDGAGETRRLLSFRATGNYTEKIVVRGDSFFTLTILNSKTKQVLWKDRIANSNENFPTILLNSSVAK